jgi:hypothetical protein
VKFLHFLSLHFPLVALSQGVALKVFQLGEVKPSTAHYFLYLMVTMTSMNSLYSNLAAALSQGVALQDVSPARCVTAPFSLPRRQTRSTP